MSECLSDQELSKKSVNIKNSDQRTDTEDMSLNQDLSKHCERHCLVHSNIMPLPSKQKGQHAKDGNLQDSVEREKGCTGVSASPTGDGYNAQGEETNNPDSLESGEVSGEECHDAHVTNKSYRPLNNADNQDEFFDDDRSETPLQDEQEIELCTKTTEYFNTDNGNCECMMRDIQLNDKMMTSQQPKLNTDVKLSDEENLSNRLAACDSENGKEVLSLPSRHAKENLEQKSASADDYGELDYEEEVADDNLDKRRAVEEKRKKERLESGDSLTINVLQIQEIDKHCEEFEESDEIKPKDRNAQKSEMVRRPEASTEEQEEGEEQEEDGEEPEDGEHSTDGELDDDDDCEEGEIREPGQKHAFVRPMCRFYTRGNCTWGNNCRFLHPGINDKGNYSMMDQSFPPGLPGMTGPMMGPTIRGPLPPPPGPNGAWILDRLGKRIIPRHQPEIESDVPVTVNPLPPPPTVAEASTESAWERGLRHAKEIRKMAKRKETGPVFEGKKDSDCEEEREQVPPTVPPVPLPLPREPYYDDIPGGRYDDDIFFGRPPMPLPPPDVWPFRPAPVDPFEMRWPRPLDYPPLPHPDFRLPERERLMRERRFSPPARFEQGRLPNDRFNRFGRYELRLYRDGPSREPLPAPPTDVPLRNRGEEWKDPWSRRQTPKRKRASSSRSDSEGRRRSRSQSKGSYSSLSSSSYSSKSRSRSASSSYSSSYSKSSKSRSSYSSKGSSSHSRSRSSSPRKPLPVATTLGQSIMEKHGKSGFSDGPRSVINKVPSSTIGSVPLPPGDKAPTSALPQVVKGMPSSPAVCGPSRTQPVVTLSENVRLPLQSSQVSVKQVSLGAPVPLGAKPIIVPGRPAPLQPVGRGVAAAFSDKDDDPCEVLSSGRSQLQPPSPLMTTAPQLNERNKALPPESESLSTEKIVSCNLPETPLGKSRELSSADLAKISGTSHQGTSVDKALGKTNQLLHNVDLSKLNQLGRSSEKGCNRSQASDGDRYSTKMSMSIEKVPVKPLESVGGRNVRGGSSEVSGKITSRGKGAGDSGGNPLPSGRPKAVPGHKSSVDKTRSSSTDSSGSRSSSASFSQSSSSASRDSEHLYSDIASPISSASTMSPAHSPVTKAQQVMKSRTLPVKNSVGRFPPLSQNLSAQQHSTHKSDGYRSDPRDRMLSSRNVPSIPSSRTRDGREVAGRSGVGSFRDVGMGDSRVKASASVSGQGLQTNQPSTRNPDLQHSFQKLDVKPVTKCDKPSNQFLTPSLNSNRKRLASPGGPASPPSKAMRRVPEPKEPVKIPIPRHSKISRPHSSPQRRRTDSDHPPSTSSCKALPPSSSRLAQSTAQSGTHTSTGGGSTSKRKGTLSRREELLMQLQAVEDAIAKKRSKMQ